VQRGTVIALTIGVAAVAAAVVRAGAGAVARALESLHLSGLLVLALLHLPIIVLMGFAWRLASGDDPPASPSRFLWARFVRDAAGEVLPFRTSAVSSSGCAPSVEAGRSPLGQSLRASTAR